MRAVRVSARGAAPPYLSKESRGIPKRRGLPRQPHPKKLLTGRTVFAGCRGASPELCKRVDNSRLRLPWVTLCAGCVQGVYNTPHRYARPVHEPCTWLSMATWELSNVCTALPFAPPGCSRLPASRSCRLFALAAPCAAPRLMGSRRTPGTGAAAPPRAESKRHPLGNPKIKECITCYSSHSYFFNVSSCRSLW